MAEHKPKGNITLFELVGKSTLKVPKNTGALKIPSWWSSKVNPPTVTFGGQEIPLAEGEAAEATAGPEQKAIEATIPPTASAPPPPLPSESAKTEAPATSEGLGHTPDRLASIPVKTPTVRPATKPVRPALKTSVPGPAPVSRPAAGVFAPQSFDPGRLARRSAGMPQVPIFAVVAGAMFLCLLILVGILMFRQPGGPAPGAPSNTAVAIHNPAPIAQTPIQIPPATPSHSTPPPTPPAGQAPTPAAAPTMKIIPGHVLSAAQVKREPNLYYLVICSAPSDRIALANAQFVVERGMSDVTIEQLANGMYSVISVQGFPKIDADAEALRKLVIEAGKQHPDFKRQKRSVYWDAYYRKIQRAN